MRGQAYPSAGQGQQSAPEFQRVSLDELPSAGMARPQLGRRAYPFEGDPVKARSAYQDFFALWKNADADIPVLKQAPAKYFKLG